MQRGELELSPLRSLDDFLLGSARFQLPNYKDLEKWGNRVVQNLLYYQTNYFLMGIILFLSVTLLHPLKMLSGALSVAVMYGLFYYLINSHSYATRFKKEHPLIGIILIFTGACLIVYLLGSLIVFMFGILLPISSIFVHASLRLRNMKNKLSNIERVMSNKTPMGIFLESLECMITSFCICMLQQMEADGTDWWNCIATQNLKLDRSVMMDNLVNSLSELYLNSLPSKK